jgi:hypothetical protein
MITPAFGLTATERVLPKLALDFTTALLDSRVTFTRTGNTATVINSSGFVTGINADLPRFDFDPVALTCKGLLIEEARTNSLKESNTFATSPWVNTRASSVTSSVVDPAGASTAVKLTEDSSASTTHLISQDVTNGNATYTFSVYLKAGERTNAAMFMSDLSTASVGINVNLTTGTFTLTTGGSWTNVSGSVTNAGNGWWRCVTTATRGAGTVTSPRVLLANSSGNISYTGDGTSGAYIYGAQLEVGAFATSYIPTVASQVTRTADVATMTGTNFSDWFNAAQGTFVTQAMSPSTFVPAHADNGTAGVSISTRSRASGVSGTAASVANISEQLTATNFTFAATNKVALAFKENDFAWSLNGATPATDTSGTLPTVDRMRFGSNVTSTFSGHLQKVFFYPQRLTTAEVQAFSK